MKSKNIPIGLVIAYLNHIYSVFTIINTTIQHSITIERKDHIIMARYDKII